MAKKGGRIAVGARLPPDLWERLREYADANGMHMSEALERAVSEFLESDGGTALIPDLIQMVEEWRQKQQAANGSR